MTDTVPIAADPYHVRESDAELVRAAQHSLAGFKPLYLRWLGPVYRYFLSRVANVKDAEDLTSQVFLKVYEELPRYHDRGRFPAWLFTIVRNKTSDYFRAGHAQITLEEADLCDETGDPFAQVLRTDELRRLRRLIWALPEEELELIRLRFVAELGYREIGELLQRKEDAVRKSLARLLDRLQGQLEAPHE